MSRRRILVLTLAVTAIFVGIAVHSLSTQEVTPLEQVTATVTPEVPTVQIQPEPEPEHSPVEQLLSKMTTEEKIGQLFMMDFRKNSDGSDMIVLSEDAKQQIADYHLGGVILFGENLDTTEQTIALTGEIQSAAALPLLIGIDEEGGTVSRLNASQIPHNSVPSAGKIDSNQAAEDSAIAIGTVLSLLGIHVDFAPVADVNTNPNNPVIGSRAYSDDPDIAAQRVSAFVEGLQSTGIAGAAKHFPGHGDTSTDSHTGNAVVSHDLERLESVEFLPFEAAIQSGVEMVLVGHIQLPNVTGDDIPATLNPQIMDLLRINLSYDGIAITDAMNMGAITNLYGAGESAVMAIEAGIDIVLMPADLPEAFSAVLEAVNSGRITSENLEDSVTRVLQLKFDLGLLE